ncbi:AsmA family protein [Neptunomonas sp.]|uniref:AsmA family protein n=1 Tax=Neptunomonas sp. TaxID=1971898 RepID=UPI0025DB7E72|nr:AsmA family protein [Neptunomonas sp.]
MGKLIKIVLGLVLVCIILIAAGGALLSTFIDPNDYKSEIEQAALDQGGIELNIGGNISWSVFPRLSLAVDNIDARFPGQPSLAHLQQAQISVRIMELFSGNVQMNSIIIEGLNLDLTKSKSGKVNWQSNTPDETAQNQTPQESNQDNSDPSTPSGTSLKIDIESVQVVSGTVNYSDEQTSQRFLVNNINLKTGRITNNELFPFNLSLNVKQLQSGKQVMEAATQFEGMILLDLSKQQYQLKDFIGQLNIKNGTNLHIQFKTNANADLIARQLIVDSWNAEIANLHLNGKLAITNLDTLDMNGTVTAAPFALNPLLETLGQAPVQTSDPAVLQSIGLISTFSGNADAINTKSLTLKLDDTSFDGNAGINLNTSRIKLKLAGNSINLDRYLPAAENQTATTEKKEESSSAEGYSKEEIIPLEPLQSLNLDAAISLKSATYQKFKMNNLDFAIDANKGIVKAKRINVDMYSGKIRNSITLDARKKPLKITTNKTITGLQIGELLTDLVGEAQLTGTFSTTSNITTYGQSVHSIVNNMNGKANVTVLNGVVNGINMAQELCQTINNLSAAGSVKSAQTVDQSTPFAKMGGNFIIKKGVISNNDLGVKLDAMNIKGKGAVNLPKALVDYQLALIIEENLFKKTCPVNNRLEGVEWPVRCKGSFDLEPTELCKPDTKAIRNILKKAVTSKIKDKLGSKVQDKLKDKLGDDDAVKGLLKGLFK